MSYSAASRLGMGKGKNDGWFVGFAPRRDPEIVVAAVVEDTAEHGGTASGPVVRDIVKAYYDKKNKKTPGTSDCGKSAAADTGSGVNAGGREAPKAVLKERETAAGCAGEWKKKARRGVKF